MSSRLLVLAWHNIDPTWAFSGRSAEAARRSFRRQLNTLAHCAHVIPLKGGIADLMEGRPLPPRAVALTFDDGYLDNLTVAAPLLRAAGLPATFFLVPGFLSGTADPWWESLGWAFARATATELTWAQQSFDISTPGLRRATFDTVAESLKQLDSDQRNGAVAALARRLAPEDAAAGPQRQFLDWDEAHELVRAGFDVGSHTVSHPILSCEAADTQRKELLSSREQLEGALGRPVDLLAFPNGRPEDYGTTSVRLAEEAGYACALTTRRGLNGLDTPRYELRRVLLEPETDIRAVLVESARVLKRATLHTSAVGRWLTRQRPPQGEP
jgi:peptidoglycan/xylan/chitin deacetylase (PgdA/CDA1 family)